MKRRGNRLSQKANHGTGDNLGTSKRGNSGRSTIPHLLLQQASNLSLKFACQTWTICLEWRRKTWRNLSNKMMRLTIKKLWLISKKIRRGARSWEPRDRFDHGHWWISCWLWSNYSRRRRALENFYWLRRWSWKTVSNRNGQKIGFCRSASFSLQSDDPLRPLSIVGYHFQEQTESYWDSWSDWGSEVPSVVYATADANPTCQLASSTVNWVCTTATAG